MLKGLLPWIKNLLKKKKETSPQNQNLNASLNASGNLISDRELLQKQTTFNERSIAFFQLGILFTSVIFLGLYYYDSYLNSHLSSLKKEQEILMRVIEDYSDFYQTATKLDSDISYYKDSEDAKKYLGQKMRIVKDIPETININSYAVDSATFNISAEGDSPLPFTKMILAYLETKEISEIQINSATYQSSNDAYKVTLEGRF